MFKFGARSQDNLKLVKQELVEVCRNAILITEVDFGIYEGLRTIEAERENIRNGSSHLANPRDCKHCPQFDGFGHAVDAVPFVDGAFRWNWDYCYEVAKAFQTSALQYGVIIRWGGVWDKKLNDLSTDLDKEVDDYRERFESTHNRKAFLDGVHFEFAGLVANNATNDKALVS